MVYNFKQKIINFTVIIVFRVIIESQHLFIIVNIYVVYFLMKSFFYNFYLAYFINKINEVTKMFC